MYDQELKICVDNFQAQYYHNVVKKSSVQLSAKPYPELLWNVPRCQTHNGALGGN